MFCFVFYSGRTIDPGYVPLGQDITTWIVEGLSTHSTLHLHAPTPTHQSLIGLLVLTFTGNDGLMNQVVTRKFWIGAFTEFCSVNNPTVADFKDVYV